METEKDRWEEEKDATIADTNGDDIKYGIMGFLAFFIPAVLFGTFVGYGYYDYFVWCSDGENWMTSYWDMDEGVYYNIACKDTLLGGSFNLSQAKEKIQWQLNRTHSQYNMINITCPMLKTWVGQCQ